MTLPKVSILIPTYNRSFFLKQSIESVLNQTFSDFELIIFDNASTDNTKDVVEQFLFDRRVKYYRNDVNVGPVNNHNLALRNAIGQYIVPFSDDDIMLPGNLEEKVKILETNPNVVLVHSSINTIDNEGKVIGEGHWGISTFIKHNIKGGIQSGNEAKEVLLNSWNYISMTSVMLRREILDVLCIEFNNRLKYLIDWDLWLHLSIGGDFFYITKPLVYYRIHENNETNNINKLIYANELAIMKVCFYYVTKPKFNLDDLEGVLKSSFQMLTESDKKAKNSNIFSAFFKTFISRLIK